MKQTIFIIPSYCPGDVLIRLCREIYDEGSECVVVNDGSPKEYDRIFAEVKDYSLVLKHDINKGKGAALKTAFKYVDDNYEDGTIVCVNGDGQHLVADAAECARKAKEHHDSLMLGARSFVKDSVP